MFNLIIKKPNCSITVVVGVALRQKLKQRFGNFKKVPWGRGTRTIRQEIPLATFKPEELCPEVQLEGGELHVIGEWDTNL
jgi:hypothetical protein